MGLSEGRKLAILQAILEKSNQEMADIWEVSPQTFGNWKADKTGMSKAQFDKLLETQKISFEYFKSLGE